MDSVKIVACGTSHTLVLSSPLGADASVFAFGAGGEGQLGYGGTRCRLVPTRVRGQLEGRKVEKLAAGSFHSAAIADLGSRLFMWGRGQDGQLGNGNTAYQLEPVEVHLSFNPAGFNTVKALSCGPYQTAIVCADGTTLMCGQGTSGQLGNDSNQSRSYFSRVAEPGDHRVVEKGIVVQREPKPHELRKVIEGSLWLWQAKRGVWVPCVACALFSEHTCFCKM